MASEPHCHGHEPVLTGALERFYKDQGIAVLVQRRIHFSKNATRSGTSFIQVWWTESHGYETPTLFYLPATLFLESLESYESAKRPLQHVMEGNKIVTTILKSL